LCGHANGGGEEEAATTSAHDSSSHHNATRRNRDIHTAIPATPRARRFPKTGRVTSTARDTLTSNWLGQALRVSSDLPGFVPWWEEPAFSNDG
jgi:hypothetical protein